MRKNLWLGAIVFCLIGGQSAQVAAQGRGAQQGGRGAAAAGSAETAIEAASTKEESVTTDHTIRINGEVIPYKATASTTLLKNAAGEPTGLMYSVAYTRSDVKDLSTRPVAFFYNGGPGSATMWLHMGAYGPRRVVTTEGEFTAPAPYKLVDNTETLLDKTDMVFIDAMGTGYSRIVGKGERTGILRNRRGHGGFRPVHQYLCQSQRPLEFAEVPDRRKLRDFPLGRPWKLSAESLHHALERHRADVFRARPFIDYIRSW